jgi:hypothetical protein
MTTVIVDGIIFPATYLGKGKFSKVYRVGNRAVYYTRGDCAKEALAMFQYNRIAHLPEIIRHDDVRVGNRSYYFVFSSPIYKNVTKKDSSAYMLMRMIMRLYDEYYSVLRRSGLKSRNMLNIYVMEGFVEYMRNISEVPRSIVFALKTLVHVAANCGDGVAFDFHKKNFGVNEYGTLIFRDPFYVRGEE